MAALEGRVPENALLSHDLFEGLYARTALVTDVEVVDDYPVQRARPRAPPAPLGARRLADPAAGCSRWCPRAAGPGSATACPSSRAGRSSTTCGAAWCRRPRWPSCSRPGRCCPARAAAWTAAVLARAVAFPSTRWLLAAAARPAAPPAAGACSCARLWEELRTALAQVALQLTFLAYHACEMVHAIGLTLVRLAVTQRRLLEWETAAGQAARAARRRRARSSCARWRPARSSPCSAWPSSSPCGPARPGRGPARAAAVGGGARSSPTC